MKAMYLDCFAGISGNMLLGAFLQGGVPIEVPDLGNPPEDWEVLWEK